MKIFIVDLILFFSSFQSFSQDTIGTVIILSEKTGQILDLEERNLPIVHDL